MPVDLPTGKRPGWELDAAEDEEERASVLDSCVVLQSLRQSRDQWMYFAFPRFSGRVRGKPDAVPPPHTIQFRGRCQIEIGPHIFEETSFYEVQYLAPAPAPSFIQSPWQSSPYGYTPYGQQNAQAAIQTPVAQHPASPLLSSLSSMTSISPALINQVNAAAASNPTLANLLQLAAAGKGTPEQLKTLGLLIQSLATTESSESLSSAANLAQSSTQPYTPPAPATTSVKEFDLVFQYHETSHERWILPRGAVICEKVADPRTPSLTYDIVLTMALQLPKAVQPSTEAVEADPQVVTIRLKRPQPAIWEMIWKWVGGEEKLNENRKTLDKLKKQTERVYLAHRIPENSLLTQLRNATASTYVMKSIKPGPVVAPRPKRQRKPPSAHVAASTSGFRICTSSPRSCCGHYYFFDCDDGPAGCLEFWPTRTEASKGFKT
ncbi:SWR1 complex subunit swc3 [Mycena venus]|uniref:SWR1 complex subunit swc3 n=1 Tax=Mycena venus TaxID=2733690 RepID=A0A8H6XT68_9AGAR|nr:SWR1 complex subunit swc3 [Mycena venus]